MDQDQLLDKSLLGEELTSDEKEAYLQILESDPNLALSLDRWQMIRAYLRDRIPNSDDLVLYSLAVGGHSRDLNSDEASEVSEKWETLDNVVETHSGFSDVTTQIQQDRLDFFACWDKEDRSKRSVSLWSVSVAASIILIAACVISFLVFLNLRDNLLQTVSANPGAYERVLLPDSSLVYLSGPAQLQFNERNFERELKLSGIAFFDVVHQPDPFVVHTSEAIVQVLGTRFGMRSHNDTTQVVLESGRLEVSSHSLPSESILLMSGQMTSVSLDEELPLPSVDVNIEDELLWTGFMFFRRTSMREAAERLSESRKVRVEVAPSLFNETVTGTFAPDETIEEILHALAITLNAEVNQEGDTFWIIP